MLAVQGGLAKAFVGILLIQLGDRSAGNRGDAARHLQ